MRWVFVILCIAPFAAFAQQAERPAPKSFKELYPPMPGVEYYCTDSFGARVELGHVICVTASCQTWMARCEMAVSNGTAMWRKLQDGCPTASLGVRDRLEALKNTL